MVLKMFDSDKSRRFDTTPFPKRLRWHIQNPPEGSVVWLITPAMAEEMLRLNTDNRPLSPATIRKYESRMKAGWKLTGETIIVSKKGRLLNGQHRLEACLRSGSAFPTHVVFGIDDDAFAFMDIGKTRTASDVFAINGVPNYQAMAAAAYWVWKYLNTGMSEPSTHLRPTHDQLYDFYIDHEGLQKSNTAGYRFTAHKVANPSIMTALHYLCSLKNREQADRFFEAVATGIGFKSASEPAAKLRKRLIDSRIGGRTLDDLYVGAFTVMTWNALRLKKSVHLRWRGEQNPDQPFPRIV